MIQYKKYEQYLSKSTLKSLKLLETIENHKSPQIAIDLGKLSDLQRERFEESLGYEHILHHGAIRSGKTILSLYQFVYHVLKEMKNGENAVITSSGLPALRRNIFPDLENILMENKIPHSLVMQHDSSIKINGIRVFCFGVDDERSKVRMRGFSASCWYGNEVALQYYPGVEVLLGRLDKQKIKIIWDCNPRNPEHWIQERYLKNPSLSYFKAFHWKMRDNAFLSEEYIERMELQYKGSVIYERDVLGEWIADGGNPFINIKITKEHHYYGGWCFIDPALGGASDGGTGSCTALTIVEKVDGVYHVYGKRYEKAWFDCMEEMIEEINKIRPFKIAIEGNLTRGIARKEFRRLGFWNVEEYTNHMNKYERIMTMTPLINRGEIVISEDSDKEYIQEVRLFNRDAKNNDCPDCLESAIRFIQTGDQSFGVVKEYKQGRDG